LLLQVTMIEFVQFLVHDIFTSNMSQSVVFAETRKN
jgi:hypothetical protein